MIERQYCASAYTIDFTNKTILLMYNKKLEKWLQPGGHIEGFEEPHETAIRETYEETGINIKIIGPSFKNDKYEPIAVERYINKVGDMIDIQYLAIPIEITLNNNEKNETKWYPIEDLINANDVDEGIKNKVITLYNYYKNIL